MTWPRRLGLHTAGRCMIMGHDMVKKLSFENFEASVEACAVQVRLGNMTTNRAAWMLKSSGHTQTYDECLKLIRSKLGVQPSRFSATPAQITAWLGGLFAEDVLLAFQQSIGELAVNQAADWLKEKVDQANDGTPPRGDWALGIISGVLGASEELKASGPWPIKEKK